MKLSAMALVCGLALTALSARAEALQLEDAQQMALGLRLIRVLLAVSADRIDVSAPDGSLATQADGGQWEEREAVSATREDLGAKALLVTSATGSLLEAEVVVNGRSRIRGPLPGALVIQPSGSGRGLEVVNELPLEDYVAGVVAHELSPDAPLQALMAQAIASRSFALASISYERDGSYDIDAGAKAQVYGAVDNPSPMVAQAVMATEGLVLTCESGVAMAYYHSTCGGATDGPAGVFGSGDVKVQGAQARGVRAFGDLSSEENARRLVTTETEAPCSASPLYRWERSFALDEVQKTVVARGFAAKVGTVTELKPLARSSSGRVTKLRIRGTAGCTDVELQAVRWLMNGKAGPLPSTLFVVDQVRDEAGLLTGFVFHGAGYGHGAGMCQFGAMGMARAGASYREILAHYYPGYRIVSLTTEVQGAAIQSLPVR